jgi:acetylornithine/succinyldiaminopimelate/putrescine aminotransferase
VELAQLICENSAGDKVFFCNSGAEANEAAIKLARKYGRLKRKGAYEIISAADSFHGRTLATLAATGQEAKQEAFRPLPEGFSHVPLNDIGALEQAVTEETCAVLLEPIQGEGGVYPCTQGYLSDVEMLCREREVLLILDEVQTGIYRTGRAFAHQGYGVRPDVMTLAKSLANGLPIGAVVATDEVAEAFQRGDHGTTFGGGPVVCGAALATLDAHERLRTGQNARETGRYMKDRLNAMAADTNLIDEVRGEGLMLAIQFGDARAQDVASSALGRGFVLNAVGPHIVRFLPPLVCGKQEVDALLDALHAILYEAPGCGPT